MFVRQAVKVTIGGFLALAFLWASVFMLIHSVRDQNDGRRGSGRNSLSWGPDVGSHPSRPEMPRFGAGGFENGGYGTAVRFTGEIRDRTSLGELSAAYASRGRRGLAERMARLERLPRDVVDPTFPRLRAQASVAYLLMYEGRFAEAAEWTERDLRENPSAPPSLLANLEALLGVIHLRRGEIENCLECRGPSSCIFPIAAEAVHQKPSGSRAAIEHFTSYLRKRPDDLGVRWLLNVAYMTLGEYPDKVPSEWRIPLDSFRSHVDIGRFENVASEAGLNTRGPNMAGGSVLDDFTGDGLPDVFTTSFDPDLGASLFVNRGDGTFEDRSGPAGLKGQTLALNCAQADYDNDGRLDVVLLRGGWENAARMSLLHNLGDGRFEDVTVAAGLGEPIASHSAAWGDFDNDGRLDLYVCGEFADTSRAGLFAGDGALILKDPRNHGRLYRNNGNGTFTDIAERAGVRNDRYAKGAAWGDFDGDGDADLYVSNLGQENRLYRNNGDGTFVDVAHDLGVAGPVASFSCGFLDFDNDGRLDLFVSEYNGAIEHWIASQLGQGSADLGHPWLYHNEGGSGFREVGASMGMDRMVMAMGMGIGDVDNDGYPDIYLGTGRPDFSALVPNVLYKNIAGRRFEDITTSSGTGHLQKGHGISFADFDRDGDVDFFVEVGGAVPGDRATNLLFRNPGHGRHWLEVKLVGTRSNRTGIGARIQADFTTRSGAKRSVYRQVGATSSYGGSSLVEHVGLVDATTVDTLTIAWPASRTTQTFHRIPADRTIEVTEGAAEYREVGRPAHLTAVARPSAADRRARAVPTR